MKQVLGLLVPVIGGIGETLLFREGRTKGARFGWVGRVVWGLGEGLAYKKTALRVYH